MKKLISNLVKRENSVPVLRLIIPFIVLYMIFLYRSGFAAGMLPVWMLILTVITLLSFKPILVYIFTHRLLKGMLILSCIIFILVESMILYYGVRTSIKVDSDYIIVLGAGVRGDTMTLTLRRRVIKAYDYLILHPNTTAILSGGQGPGENISEAEAMRRYLVDKGIAENRLILEPYSTSTQENIEYSYNYIKDKEAKVITISSSFHLLRAKLVARSLGYNVQGIGASTIYYLVPNYYLREFFGVVYQLLQH